MYWQHLIENKWAQFPEAKSWFRGYNKNAQSLWLKPSNL